MVARPYSFIDIVVLEPIRQRFCAGDALLVLTTGLDEIIWANGPGARLLGFPDFESTIGGDPGLPFAARRQIQATRGYPKIGTDRPVAVRLPSGLSGQLATFLASEVTLPDGAPALLLASPAADAEASDPAAVARRAISGLSGEGRLVAMLGADGEVLGASKGFAEIGLSRETMQAIAGQTDGSRNRLAKRLVETDAGDIAAGIAHLSDDPERHLVMVVAEFGADDGPQGETVPAGRAQDAAADAPSAPEAIEAAFVEDRTAQPPLPVPPDSTAAAGGDDNWYFNGSHARGRSPEAPSRAPEPARPPAELASGPVRFVWRTDPEGRFSMIGDEFRAAVGDAAAAVIGETFRAVAARFRLDPDGEIAELLDRRDTWSGRTVLWPVAGTDLKVPLDLAALPIYRQDRSFEGFRGFGVARMGDAEADPDAIGLALTGPDGGQAQPPAADEKPASTELEQPAEDPFRGEVPALEVADRPERRYSDKVIRLAEHRPATSERTLSNVERLNFREIGERLRQSGIAASREVEKEKTGQAGTETRQTHQVEPPLAGIGEEALQASARAKQDEAAAADAGSRAVANPAAWDAEPVTIGEAAIELQEASWPAFDATAAPPVVATDIADEAPEAAAAKDEGRVAAAAIPSPSTTETARTAGATAEDAAAEPLSAPDDKQEEPEGGGAQPVADVAGHPDAPAAGATAEADPEARDAAAESRTDEARTPSHDTGADETGTDEAGKEEPATEPVGQNGWQEAEAARERVPAADTAGGEAAIPAPVLQAAAGGAGERTAAVFIPSAYAGFGQEKLPGLDTTILSRLPVPLLVHSGDLLHYANREMLQLSGYATLAGLAEAGGLDALFAAPHETPPASDRKMRFRRRNGEEIPVDALLQSVAWNGGKALLLALRPFASPAAVPAADPAGSPEVEARIAELTTILDTATDGIVIIDDDGKVRSISRAAEALFNLDSSELAGRPFETLFAIESQRAAREYLNGLASNGVASVLNDGREVIGREAQGRFIPLFMTIGRLPNKSGYCAVMRDITQWKRAEEELTQARSQAERASSQKTDFLARVSHEIRTPLNAIIGFSELMIDEKFGPISNERYRDYLRDINKSGNHVLDLVNDLLDISKIEAGEQELSYEAVSLNDTLGETVAMMQPQANRERVIIRSSFSSRLPEIVADLRSVRQIALNLLSNAVRYTPAGGQVIVSTSYEPSGDIIMRVRDTGIGMSAAELEQALKPFKQINALKRPRGDGTGLGLPLTKAMVEANRARFAIHSTPGEGTLVEIVFPSTRVLAH